MKCFSKYFFILHNCKTNEVIFFPLEVSLIQQYTFSSFKNFYYNEIVIENILVRTKGRTINISYSLKLCKHDKIYIFYKKVTLFLFGLYKLRKLSEHLKTNISFLTIHFTQNKMFQKQPANIIQKHAIYILKFFTHYTEFL